MIKNSNKEERISINISFYNCPNFLFRQNYYEFTKINFHNNPTSNKIKNSYDSNNYTKLLH